jgi:hypothetical protein
MKRITLLISAILIFLISELDAQPFEQLVAPIQGVGRSVVAWGDYDNDGDLDFVLCGITPSGTYLSKIYENDNGNFTVTDAVLTGVKDGSVAWGDFDNDNDLDILITGETENDGDIALIYRNDDGIFNEYDAGLPGVSYGDGAWGDYDNDGDLDILITGNWIVSLYENIDGVFTLTQADFGHLQSSRAAWGDFDNDGDLDFILSGMTADEVPFTQLFLNMAGSNEFVVNTLPDAPEGLETIVDGQSVTFSWEKAGDAQTPQDGLYYNLRLGSYSGGIDKITPMAAEESGYRIIQAIGNTNMNNSWTISGLMPGTYYWSVQTIDQAYSGSGFSEEGTCMVIATAVNEFEEGIISNIFPNPASDRVFLYSKTQDEFEISIINTSGQQVYHALVSSGDPVDVSFLKEGIYFIKASEGTKTSVHRLVKR